jgi:hypothetical protein
MGLSDLDELVISCRSEEARSYVSEAVACYKAGAFKACIVATWIAVVYDLLAKIRELALGGDAEAQQITDEVTALQHRVGLGDQAAIRRILEIERDVVKTANEKFGFFEEQQIIELRRIQDDRNRCGHPTYQGMDQPYSPTPELARAHLVHAVRHVLAIPPVQGKAATSHIVRLVESNFFPTNIEQAKVQLRSGGLDRPKDSLVRSVIDHLVFGLFEAKSTLKGQRRTVRAVRATYELFPSLCEPRIRKALNALGRRVPDEDLIIFFGLQRCLPQTWAFLEQDNKTRLTELARQSSDEVAITLLPVCLEIVELEEMCRARVNALSNEYIRLLLQASKHPIAIACAVDLYCSSKNWDQANSNYKSLEPVLQVLEPSQIRRILVASANEGADLNGAHSFTNFVRYIYDHERLPREEMLSMLRDHAMEWLVRVVQREGFADDNLF